MPTPTGRERRITEKMLECARLQATGEWSVRKLAKRCNVSERTVATWLTYDEVKEEYRRALRAGEGGIVARARKVIEKSLDSDAANGYLALNAAQTALTQFGPAVMGDDKQEVTITIVGGMPDVGMPDRSDND